MLQNPSPRSTAPSAQNAAPPQTPVGGAATDGSLELDDNAIHAFIKLEVSASTIERVATRLQRGQLWLRDARRLSIALSFLKAAENELTHACAERPAIRVLPPKEPTLFAE